MSVDDLTHKGRFAVLAIDHRDSLRSVLAPDNPDSVSHQAIVNLKHDLVVGLAGGATGVMLEPEYSIPQLLDGTLPPGVGFTAALEAQGYMADPEAAPVALLDGWSAQAAADCGAAAAKLLVLYRPDRPHATAQEKAAAEIVAECRRVGIPLLVEPLFYALDDPSIRPKIVLDTVDRFAPMGPDVLKLPFPIDPDHDADQARWAAACSEITARSDMPWTLLSGGGAFESYHAQLDVAMASGCSGFTVGRALWGEAALAPPADRPRIIDDLIAPRLAALKELVA
ncbi:2-deoxy-5-keto-D-gluconate 6-phosphate aldolase domain-containing protein [Candidatus Poriferisocius sp.]|uniref:2-deoxy-5-keto-D-gluconate 6-phosphate aldolase domain-containing protein n=1 Tax=Candidatus Poriferisocius sp. TaxID=3101276 RepID=UPI003B014BA4